MRYLTPTQEDYGHWTVKDGESPRLTKCIMKKSIEPVTNATWLALERELAASLTIRRRLRNKTTIRSISSLTIRRRLRNKTISGVIEEGEEELDKAAKIRGVRMLEEEAEMKKAVAPLWAKGDDPAKRRGVQHRVPNRSIWLLGSILTELNER